MLKIGFVIRGNQGMASAGFSRAAVVAKRELGFSPWNEGKELAPAPFHRRLFCVRAD
jgi:hypothetical protein